MRLLVWAVASALLAAVRALPATPATNTNPRRGPRALAFSAKKSAGSAAPVASAANAPSLPPPPGGSWRATAKHIRVEANATGYVLKAKLETQQTGIVPGIFGPRRRWRDAETHFKQRDAFENRDGYFVRKSKVQAASEEETLRWREEWNVLGPLETLAFAASGRARVSKCWGLWQGARLKTRLLASRKELAETKSELKLARVNLAKAERQLRRQQSATSAVSSVKKTREESRRPRAKWNLKACLNFKRLKETLLAVLTLLAEFAGSGGFN